MAQIKAWMKSVTNVFKKINDIHNLGSSRVSHQAQNKPLPFDSGQTSQATDSVSHQAQNKRLPFDSGQTSQATDSVSHQAQNKRLPFDSGQTSQATDSVESPELYLNLATKCMEGVQEVMIGGVSTEVKMNRNQCEYLVGKLETTVTSGRKSFFRSSSPEHKAECLETLKLLYQLSSEVERFIQDCCEDTWVQSALLWANMTVRVTSLGYYLELCTELLRNNNKLGSALLVCTKLEGLSQVELQSVTKRASLDRGTLIKSLISLSRKSEIKESQLANIILARLTSKEAPEAMRTASSSPLSLPLSQSSFLIADSGITSIKRLKLLGRGSSGSIHKGIWMGAEVAVRWTRGVSENGIVQTDLDVLESLSHPNIVNALGYCWDDGKDDISIVLELMDEDLFSLISRRNRSHNDGEEMKTPFTIAETVDLMLQVAEGVNYLHQNRTIHRDLKSHHILVKHIKGKEAKIIAKVAHPWKIKEGLTHVTTLVPSVNRWLAPELLSEEAFTPHSFKSDVYSFAMLCYEILTGDVPFSNIPGSYQLSRRILEGDRPTLPAQCPVDLKSLIEICWASEAEQRPSSSEICKELRYLKCLFLLDPFSQILTHQQDQPIAILDLPGLSHLKVELSCLDREMQLGKGGSETTVYSAYWRHPFDVIQDLVAQKRFIGANNEEFKKEITILAALKHRNVIRILGYATDTRSCSIIMEKMDGDLRDLLRQRSFQGRSIPTGFFAMDEAIYIMLQIAQGMHYVHLENVAHRDLKTCNILVRNSGQSVKHWLVKVADFGVSEKKSQAGNFENVSYNVGTLRWMAPEVIKHKNGEDIHVDSPNYDLLKCDVYSFAMVCFEILTGTVPFAHIKLEGFHENQVLPLKGLKKDQIEVLKKKVLDGERPLIPEFCPPKLKTLIESCWNGDARARPSFGEICEELKGLL